MAYHVSFCDIFTHLGYPCDPYNGAYSWGGATPSASVITAVEALPTTMIGLVNLDPTAAEDLLAVAALVSGSAWSGFVAWHTEQWEIQLETILATTRVNFKNCISLFKSEGFAVCMAAAKAAWNAAGITRHPC